ncbi:MAG: helix-turn-helix domain-containing protein [Armatimonadetes bacterium]|nr:helix-turn-helix domain-containing protein [Armatimonadota bacterium]
MSGKALDQIGAEPLYTVREIATMMRVCEKTVRREIDTGRLGHATVRNSLRVPASEYAAYVARHTQRGSA